MLDFMPHSTSVDSIDFHFNVNDKTNQRSASDCEKMHADLIKSKSNVNLYRWRVSHYQKCLNLNWKFSEMNVKQSSTLEHYKSIGVHYTSNIVLMRGTLISFNITTTVWRKNSITFDQQHNTSWRLQFADHVFHRSCTNDLRTFSFIVQELRNLMM